MSISWNYTDSSVEKVGVLQPASVNYSLDFRKKETKANQAILLNLTSPLDRQETVRFATDRIANVYTGSGIPSSLYAPNRSGVSALVQVNDVLTSVDDTDGTRVDLPVSAHIVLRVPIHAAVTGEVLTTLVKRLIGFLYEQSATTPDARLNALIRGALLPTVLV